MRNNKGFSFMEIMTVIGILAILAAIAVPNFLEFQVRAKVARSLTDMRTIATGLEAYNVETGYYPPRLVGPPAKLLLDRLGQQRLAGRELRPALPPMRLHAEHAQAGGRLCLRRRAA